MPDLATLHQTEPFKLPQLGALAEELIAAMGNATCVVLRGDMGSGKTTLVNEIGRKLGVTENMASPSFSIVNEYRTLRGNRIFHFDFYRLMQESEALDMGVEEYFDSGSLCFVEWPERIPNLLPPTFFEIELRLIDAGTRAIRYGKH